MQTYKNTSRTLTLHTFLKVELKKVITLCIMQTFAIFYRYAGDITLGHALCVQIIVALLLELFKSFSFQCSGGEILDHIEREHTVTVTFSRAVIQL